MAAELPTRSRAASLATAQPWIVGCILHLQWPKYWQFQSIKISPPPFTLGRILVFTREWVVICQQAILQMVRTLLSHPPSKKDSTNSHLLDPVFAFHHTQVDRLWWKWQQNNPAARTNAYEGPRYSIKNPSITTSTLSDLMNMAGLATDLPVSSVMSTQSDLLCYTY